jgi:phosphomannomutase
MTYVVKEDAIPAISFSWGGSYLNFSEWVAITFTHSDRIQKFVAEKNQKIIAQGKQDSANLLTQLRFDNVAIKSVDETDGLRVTLEDEPIVHFRPSGNAPELCCYVEAENYSAGSDCVIKSLENIQ